jgi:putative endonuclease
MYLLKSKKDGSIYTGYTNDLKRRFEEHNNGENISTKHKTPFELVYYEAYKSESDAKYREKQLKRFAQGSKALKNRLKNSLV